MKHEEQQVVNEIASLVNHGEVEKAVTVLNIEKGLAYMDGQLNGERHDR